MGRNANIITNFLKIAKKRGKVISSTIDIERKQGIHGRKRGNRMKKFNLIILVMTLFSFVAGSLSGLKQVHAETTKTELIDEKYLKVDYDCEEKDNENNWRISFKRQSEDKNFDQRLKLKITDEKDKAIEYPVVENMKQKDGWLIEENFTQTMEGQVTLNLSKSVEKLRLYVQLDQKEAGKEDAKVHEDTLDREKPFELKIKKDEDDEKEDVEKKDEAVTVGSEAFIGAQSGSKLPSVANTAFLSVGLPSYKNIEPAYSGSPSTSTGKYPTKSWKPIGQENVINHQGRAAGANSWESLQPWDVSTDNRTKSYIRYGKETNPDVSLRKYASQTKVKNEFNIRLNVRGGSVKQPGMDVYFVLDNSTSMNGIVPDSTKSRKKLAVESLRTLVDKFKEVQDVSETGRIKLGGLYYANYQQTTDPNVALSAETSNWDRLVDNYSDTEPPASVRGNINGNTFTQKALEEARRFMPTDKSRRQVILLLTDGAPNVSYIPNHGVRDDDIVPDNFRIDRYSKGDQAGGGSFLDNDYGNPDTLITKIRFQNRVSGVNQFMTSHMTPAVSQAADAKDEGKEIHSIAIGIRPMSGELHTKDELIEGLYRMASRRPGKTGNAEENFFFYHAEKEKDFEEAFKEWFAELSYTIEDGVIEDPLGDRMSLVSNINHIEIDTAQKPGVPDIPDEKKPKKVFKDNKITISNIFLHSNQEIQIDYKIRVNTGSGFTFEKWYPANDRTTLAPTPKRTSDLLDFGVPSVKVPHDKVTIRVSKDWDDDSNESGNRPSSLKVYLQKKSATLWKEDQSKTLSNTNGWYATFDPVEGDPANKYRVVEENRVPGYSKPTYNYSNEFDSTNIPSGGIIVLNNKLLKGSTSFRKYNEEGKPFTGSDLPVFQVRRKKDNKIVLSNCTPNTSTGVVTISGLPVGEYYIEETHAPNGYIEMGIIELNVTDDDSTNGGLIFKFDGSTTSPTVKNKLKADTVFPVEKIWNDSNDEWKYRDSSVTVVLQRKKGTNWNDPDDVDSKTLTGPSWKGDFKAVEGGSNIYRVKEVKHTDGYGKPTVNYGEEFTAASLPDGKIKVTNKLLTGTATFKKVDHEGNPFKNGNLPKFDVKRKSDGKVLAAGIEPDEDTGIVTIEHIPKGEFVITESVIPDDYSGIAPINLKAVVNSAKDGLAITLDGKAGTPTVENKLRTDFEIPVVKIWDDEIDGEKNYGKLQKDVTVILQKRVGSNWNNHEELARKTLNAGNNWSDTFTGLTGGSAVYRVIEEPKVSGYFKPTYNYSGQITETTMPSSGIVEVKNKLIVGEMTVYKYSGDGKTGFSGNDLPGFSITRKSDGKVLQTGMRPESGTGKLTIPKLTVGEYTLKEDHAPDGYDPVDPITIVVKENSSGDGLEYTLDGKDPASNPIINKRTPPSFLPSTGGGTAQLMFKIAFALSGIAGLLGGAYWLYSRKG